MKNKKRGYDGDIINSILVILFLLFFLIGVPIHMSTELKIPFLWYILLALVVILGIRLKIQSSREKKEQEENGMLYGLDEEESDHFTTYFPKIDKDNLIELAKLVSNNKITNYDFITADTDADDMLCNFLENVEYIVGIDWKNELNDTVFAINDLCRKLDYKITLTENDITRKDNQVMKNRRKDKIITAQHDINVATDILRKQGYEIIGLWIDGDTFNISVIPINKIHEMKTIK